MTQEELWVLIEKAAQMDPLQIQLKIPQRDPFDGRVYPRRRCAGCGRIWINDGCYVCGRACEEKAGGADLVPPVPQHRLPDQQYSEIVIVPPRLRTIFLRGEYRALRFPWMAFGMQHGALFVGFLEKEPKQGEKIKMGTPPLPHVRHSGTVCQYNSTPYQDPTMENNIQVFWGSHFKYRFEWCYAYTPALAEAVETWKGGGPPPPFETLMYAWEATLLP